MKPKLILPKSNESGQTTEIECDGNVVIVGANGSGKSKLGAWIETYTPDSTVVQRISAQRALNIPDFAPLKNLEESMNELLWGNRDQRYATKRYKLSHKWQSQLTTLLQNDYEKLLSTLFAKHSRRDNEYVESSRKRAQEKLVTVDPPDSEVDKLHKLWKDVMPQRRLRLDDGKVIATTLAGALYQGKDMSDGERVSLYLIGQALCAPEESIIVIDEPEIHLHKSLMNRLWSLVEESKQSCLFVYITHDLEFAASRTESKKLWLKEFKGNDVWVWDYIPEIENFPEELLIEISGNRKPVLFVEGDRGSLDHAVLQAIYSDFYIVPRGGCAQVIESTKALRENSSFHHLYIQGIIDRDFRTDEELESLKSNGIYALDVAEIENLLCVPELLAIIASYLKLNELDIFIKVKEFVLSNLSREIENQISSRAALEIKFILNHVELNTKKGQDGLKESLRDLPSRVDVKSIYEKAHNLFKSIIEKSEYMKALQYYNRKSLLNQIAPIFGLESGQYEYLVLRLMKTDLKNEIIKALRSYVPEIVNPDVSPITNATDAI